VKYTTIDGTALAGVDYQATNGEVTFQPGDDPKTVHVAVMGDGDDEGTEVFFLTITQVLTGTLTDGIGEGLIVDDDAAGGGPVCGDGTVAGGEQCDDGNLAGGDGCEADCTTSPLCAGGAPFAKARIAVKKLGGPAGYDPLDAIVRGAQLLIEDLGGGGTALVDLTGSSTVPPGACAPGSAEGLAKLVLKDKRAKGGGVHFAVTVKGATIAAPVVGPLRGTLILDADPAAGPAGACGVHAFPAGACKANKKGTALTCK
jgi:cysteine-rich repeat protein